MTSTEKQDYIDKIQNLIASNEEENLSLALQLMESLDLKEDVLSLYGLNKEHIEEKYGIFEIQSHKHEEFKRITSEVECLIRFWGVNSNSYKRKVFNILYELVGVAYHELNSLKEKMIFFIYIKQQYLYIKTSIIAETDGIKKEVLEIDELNLLSLKELKYAYMNKIKKVSAGYGAYDANIPMNWICVRRKSKNPIEYQIQPYEENPEYAVFTVIVKVDIA